MIFVDLRQRVGGRYFYQIWSRSAGCRDLNMFTLDLIHIHPNIYAAREVCQLRRHLIDIRRQA
jgi:hypothetical protein